MKKIVALVLALALALSLCTVAMAADKGYQLANAKSGATETSLVQTYTSTAASTVTKDGELQSGNIAFDTIEGKNYVMGATAADADYILYKDGKVAGYAYKVMHGGAYTKTATAFTTFGTKCGTVKLTNANDDNDYYTLDGDDNAVKYVAVDTDAEATVWAKVGNTVVALKVAGNLLTENKHDYRCDYSVVAGKDPVVVKVYCNNDATETFAFETTVAKATAAFGKGNFDTVKFDNDGKATNGTAVATVYVQTASAAATTTTTVDSSKTFDAGVAMYVGLSLMSVAGSAVVIGKKKEF